MGIYISLVADVLQRIDKSTDALTPAAATMTNYAVGSKRPADAIVSHRHNGMETMAKRWSSREYDILRRVSQLAWETMYTNFLKNFVDAPLNTKARDSSHANDKFSSTFIRFECSPEQYETKRTDLFNVQNRALSPEEQFRASGTANIYSVEYISANISGLGLGAQIFNILKIAITLNPTHLNYLKLHEVFFPSFWITDSDYNWVMMFENRTNSQRNADLDKNIENIEPRRFFKRHLTMYTDADQAENKEAFLHEVSLLWLPPVKWSNMRIDIGIGELDTFLSQWSEFTADDRQFVSTGPLAFSVKTCVLQSLVPSDLALDITEICRNLGNLDYACPGGLPDRWRSWEKIAMKHKNRNNLLTIRALVLEHVGIHEEHSMLTALISYLIDYGRTVHRPVLINMVDVHFNDPCWPLGETVRMSPYFFPVTGTSYYIWCPQHRPHTTDRNTGMQIILLPEKEEQPGLNSYSSDTRPEKRTRLDQCASCKTLSSFHMQAVGFHFCDAVCFHDYYGQE